MNQTIQLNTNHNNRGNTYYSEISKIMSRETCLIHNSACYFFMSKEKKQKSLLLYCLLFYCILWSYCPLLSYSNGENLKQKPNIIGRNEYKNAT